MKTAFAFVVFLAYIAAFAYCVLTPGLLEKNVPSLFLSGGIVAILVLAATAKRRVKE